MAEIVAAAPASRFVFRGGERAVALADTAFGVALPRLACRSAGDGSRHALWLGPDEWLLLAPADERDRLEAAFREALGAEPHALVDVSQRNVGLVVSGEAAADLLAIGCPLDLDAAAFPVGMCARTVLGRAEIVLWRTEAAEFRIEVWRSFEPYVRGLLAEAASEHA
jgi:sarcosine oxidase subunit gamma